MKVFAHSCIQRLIFPRAVGFFSRMPCWLFLPTFAKSILQRVGYGSKTVASTVSSQVFWASFSLFLSYFEKVEVTLEWGMFETGHGWTCLSLGFQVHKVTEVVTVRMSTHPRRGVGPRNPTFYTRVCHRLVVAPTGS